MKALVLSGAANFGAMQAGALEALFATGYCPQVIVGTSAGALNAIFLAADPSPSGAHALKDLWRQAGPSTVGVPTTFSAVRGLLSRRDGLVSNQMLSDFLRSNLPEAETFGQLASLAGVQAFAAAVDLESGALRLFGDREEDRLLDGAMASVSVPPYYPPWEVDGRRYMDGGVLAKLPMEAAVERGAGQLVAINISNIKGSRQTAHGVLGLTGYSVSLMIDKMTRDEVASIHRRGVPLRYIHLDAPDDIPFWDYTKADELIDLGRVLAQSHLEEEPLLAETGWWRFVRKYWPFRKRKD
jgi:NTE family protein